MVVGVQEFVADKVMAPTIKAGQAGLVSALAQLEEVLIPKAQRLASKLLREFVGRHAPSDRNATDSVSEDSRENLDSVFEAFSQSAGSVLEDVMQATSEARGAAAAGRRSLSTFDGTSGTAALPENGPEPSSLRDRPPLSTQPKPVDSVTAVDRSTASGADVPESCSEFKAPEDVISPCRPRPHSVRAQPHSRKLQFDLEPIEGLSADSLGESLSAGNPIQGLSEKSLGDRLSSGNPVQGLAVNKPSMAHALSTLSKAQPASSPAGGPPEVVSLDSLPKTESDDDPPDSLLPYLDAVQGRNASLPPGSAAFLSEAERHVQEALVVFTESYLRSVLRSLAVHISEGSYEQFAYTWAALLPVVDTKLRYSLKTSTLTEVDIYSSFLVHHDSPGGDVGAPASGQSSGVQQCWGATPAPAHSSGSRRMLSAFVHENLLNCVLASAFHQKAPASITISWVRKPLGLFDSTVQPSYGCCNSVIYIDSHIE